jgi:putative copper export protein
MMKYIILLHVLAATVWVGGHLVLALGVLPSVLKNNDVNLLLSFEQRYEKVGMPALLLSIITGIYMALQYLPLSAWFNFSNHLSMHISIKIILLLTSLAIALHARFRIVPHLSEKNLKLMAAHIIAITTIAVFFVVTGLSIRLNIY